MRSARNGRAPGCSGSASVQARHVDEDLGDHRPLLRHVLPELIEPCRKDAATVLTMYSIISGGFPRG
jgi:hypothetical protein